MMKWQNETLTWKFRKNGQLVFTRMSIRVVLYSHRSSESTPASLYYACEFRRVTHNQVRSLSSKPSSETGICQWPFSDSWVSKRIHRTIINSGQIKNKRLDGPDWKLLKQMQTLYVHKPTNMCPVNSWQLRSNLELQILKLVYLTFQSKIIGMATCHKIKY